MPHDNDHWVDEQLKTLNDTHGWQPSLESGEARLEERQRDRRRGFGGGWMPVAAIVAGAAVLGVSAIRMVDDAAVPADDGADAQGVTIRMLDDRTVPADARANAQGVTSTAPVWSPDGTRVFFPRSPASGVRLDRRFFDGSLIAADQRVPAADFTLTEQAGSLVSLSDSVGEVVLLNFWATWCFPCREEIPWFIQFEETYGPRGLSTLGVSMDEGWSVVRPYASEVGMTYPVLLADDTLPPPYAQIAALPVTALIDREGRFAAVHPSMVDRDRVEEQIRRLLKE